MSKLTDVKIERCSREQLKVLLSLAAGRLGEGAPLQASVAGRNELEQLLGELCGEGAEAGELLLSTVCEEEVPVEVLNGIKELSKKILADAKTESHRSAATFLYHATIAAAYGCHGVNLSSRPIDVRSAFYEDLATAFADDPLGYIFRRAADRTMNIDSVFPPIGE